MRNSKGSSKGNFNFGGCGKTPAPEPFEVALFRKVCPYIFLIFLLAIEYVSNVSTFRAVPHSCAHVAPAFDWDFVRVSFMICKIIFPTHGAT
jgi:hypothetical protein